MFSKDANSPDNPNELLIKLDFSIGFRLDNQNTRFVICSRTTDSPPHTHTFFEIMYVLRGTVAHAVNFSNPIIMKPGDFVLIDIDAVHEYASITNEGCEVINIAFAAPFIDKRLSKSARVSNIFKSSKLGLKGKYTLAPSGDVLHDYKNNVLGIINLMLSEMDKPDDLSYGILRHYLLSLLAYASRYKNDEKNDDFSQITANLINCIENNYMQHDLLKHTAEDMSYSVPYLSNKFRKEVGIPFNTYLQNYRIEIAKKLLNTTKMQICEISTLVGYTDNKHFTEIFKRIVGMTPSSYKKTIARYLPSDDVHI